MHRAAGLVEPEVAGKVGLGLLASHWYTGTHWYTHWRTGTLVHTGCITLVHWYTHWYTGILVHWYPGCITLVHTGCITPPPPPLCIAASSGHLSTICIGATSEKLLRLHKVHSLALACSGCTRKHFFAIKSSS